MANAENIGTTKKTDATSVLIPPEDRASDARVAQAEHASMVEAQMLMIDALEEAESTGRRMHWPHFREAVAKKMRESASRHAVAVAALVFDADPEYAEELLDYAVEIDPPKGEES